MVGFQKHRVGFFELVYALLHARKVTVSVTVGLLQTQYVIAHQRTVCIEIKTFVIGVVTERVERTAERLFFPHVATLRSQVIAARLYANRAEFFLFRPGEGDLKWGVARLDVATSLAFGAVIKQHANTPWRMDCLGCYAPQKNVGVSSSVAKSCGIINVLSY